MFDYVSGKVASVGENRVVVDCGGVGFALTATSAACARAIGNPTASFPVYMAVRDDAIELFGFSDEKERELFLLLITVSGVGPKLAVTVLGGMAQDRLLQAIACADVAALSTIKGVGKKTAERIALELKNKIADNVDAGLTVGDVLNVQPVDDKVLAALMGLGYERKEAEAAIKKVAGPDMSTEEIIRAVLKG
ncbi:MAG: Holliday junction branch migration protein RuvA [Clostridiales bacterium]|nr:Holliday junction branch migration protein RuvA [Clostridiales bacterium]